MSIRIPDFFIANGIITVSSPESAALQLFRKFTPQLRELHDRVVQRTKIDVIEIRDGDPRRAGAQKAIIDVKPGSGDMHRLAAQWAAMIVVKGKAGIYIDEAKRMLAGQPVKSLDGHHALDEPDTTPLSEKDTQLLFASLRAGAGGHRSLFGVDDAIIIGGLFTLGVAFLCAVIPVMVPLIFELGQGAIKMVAENAPGPIKDVLDGALGDEKKEESAPAPPPSSPFDAVMSFVQENALILAAGAAAIAGAWYFAKRA